MNTNAQDEPRPGQTTDAPEEHDGFQASFRAGESLGVSRKKVLMRLLAVREAERLGMEVDSAQLANTLEAFKRQFGFATEVDLDDWLAEAGIDRPAFDSFMREVALVDLLDMYYEELVLQGLPLQRKAQTVHGRRQGVHRFCPTNGAAIR